jgi:hypothetical protein
VRIGQYDSWNERDNIMSVGAFERRTKVVDLAHTVAIPNDPNDMWRFARDALLEFGCTAHQAAQLMSNTKDIRQLQGCEDLDPDVHVLRAFLGRCAHRGRLHLHSDPAYRPAVEECIKTGITVIDPDELGLTDEQRAGLLQELSSSRGALSKNPYNMMSTVPGEYSTCRTLLAMITPILSQITGYSSQTIAEELDRTAFSQRVINGPEDNDIQKVMHQDTWFDAWKFWYFPRDVRLGEGPFRFARNSHGLSAARLRLTREFATCGKTWESWRSVGHDEGSWRANDAELATIGCEAEDITCFAGTLVIANVYGFHARGEANETRERIALHGSIRLNPWAI